jgi:hypothetical protein
MRAIAFALELWFAVASARVRDQYRDSETRRVTDFLAALCHHTWPFLCDRVPPRKKGCRLIPVKSADSVSIVPARRILVSRLTCRNRPIPVFVRASSGLRPSKTPWQALPVSDHPLFDHSANSAFLGWSRTLATSPWSCIFSTLPN